MYETKGVVVELSPKQNDAAFVPLNLVERAMKYERRLGSPRRGLFAFVH